MRPEKEVDQALEAVLKKAVEEGLNYPDVLYYKAVNGRSVLELGHWPEGRYCTNGQPKRFSYQHAFDLVDTIGTEARHICVVGGTLTEVLKAQQSTKH
jgi:hypothetical protein